VSRSWRRWILPLAAAALAAAGAFLAGSAQGERATGDELRPTARTPESGSWRRERSEARIRVTPAMRRYSYWRYAFAFAAPVVELLALGVLLESRLSARLRDAAERRFRGPFARAAAYTLFFGAVYTVLTLPLTFFSGWYLGRCYGITRQSLPAWLWDGVKGFLVGVGIAAPLVWLLYACLRRGSRRWWLAFWLASLPVMVFLTAIAPVLIAPLFDRFQPLRDDRLRERILDLAARAGIEGGRVFQVNMGQKTRALNAYVAGLGETKRIVLWDTLLDRLDPEEILFVMAHEMGHYVLGHVPLLLGFGAVGLFAAFGVGDGAARSLLARRGPRWGVRGMDDLASLPLLLGVLIVLEFLGRPVVGGVSRALERQADAFGISLTGDGRAAARAFVKLSEGNLHLPDPPRLVVFWLSTHPPLKERIERALE
jgi:Zn-dependent protease with chaperone function